MIPSPLRERVSLPAAGRGEGVNDKYAKRNKSINFLNIPPPLNLLPKGRRNKRSFK